MRKTLSLTILLLSLLLSPQNSWAVIEFTATVCSSGCDYTLLSTAEAALDNATNLTSATAAKCGANSTLVGTIADGAAVTWDAGVSTGTMVHETSTQYFLTVTSGTLDALDIVSDGTNTFVASTVDTCQVTMDLQSSISDSVLLDGVTTGATNYTKITSSAPYRHNGTAASGVIITGAGANVVKVSDPSDVVEWLIIKTTVSSSGNGQCVYVDQTNTILRNSIIANCENFGSGIFGALIIGTNSTDETADNNIIFGAEAYGITLDIGGGLTMNAYNNTVYGTTGGKGITENSTNGTSRVVNNISMNNSSADFDTSFNTYTNNMSEDTSGNIASKDINTQFVNIGAGTEDFHLVTGSDCKDAGTDLGTSPQNIQFDIDNYDRDTTGVTWDCGADEFVAQGASTATPTISGLKIGGIIISGM